MTFDFHDPRAHGFVRVASATPLATVGDTERNAAEAIALAEEGHSRGVDLIVYPELNLTSYALDDLHMQDAQIAASLRAIETVREASADLRPLLLVGAGLVRRSSLYNCALAIHRGRVLGAVPKSFLPNYREFYEKRLFAPGVGLAGLDIDVNGDRVPFGTDLLFAAEGFEDFLVHAEICEDYWAAVPPSSLGALAGATVLTNLSASNIVIGKARERDLLSAAHSARTVSAYVYSAAGPGESTTDLSWDGQGTIFELGDRIATSTRFDEERELLVADVDVGRIRQHRLRMGTYNDAARAAGDPETRFRRIPFTSEPSIGHGPLLRDVPRFPFVPADPGKLDEDCFEAFNIQVEGLAKRLDAAHAKTAIIGVSGGLDSTHALIVTAKAFDRLGRDRKDILGFTLPGFATGDTTKGNAWALMRAIGCTAEEIDITPAARLMLDHMDHPFSEGEPVYDVTFENVQAGLRTDYLFRLAGQRGGLVVGTGDLSELALGWCTYGVGDQMSHYAVNAGVPKTLIQHLIRWSVATDQFDEGTNKILLAILDTEISPELVPAGEDGAIQSTESKIGPYALHDFFLHHIVRNGALPSKVAFLALQAWQDIEWGEWPRDFPEAKREAYDLATIRRWLDVFLRRFFAFAQFKRSAIPNGPKVSSAAALSPRGDWRAPSDGTAAPWLEDLERVPKG